MKQIWTSRLAQAAGKYGEHAPMATVCCNACRTCVTTNIVGIAFLSRYAVAEEVDRGELESFRIAGRPRIDRNLCVARLARRPLSPSERGFVETLTRCCAKSEEFAAACVA